MLAVLVAVKTEFNSLLGNVLVESSSTKNGCTLISGQFAQRDILLVQMGIGKERAQAAAGFILEKYPISTIINIGFGGALNHDLEIGDLILCRKIQSMNGMLSERSFYSDRNLIDLALHALGGESAHLLAGSCITVKHLLTEPGEKAALGNLTQADVVDMESYWIAEIAAERGLKFLAARTISDTSAERLPPFDRFMNSDETWQLKDAANHFISRPLDLTKLPQLYLHAADAAKSLRKLFLSLIPLILEPERGKPGFNH